MSRQRLQTEQFKQMQIHLMQEGISMIAGADHRLLMRWGKLALGNLRKAKAYCRQKQDKHWSAIHALCIELLNSIAEQLEIIILDCECPFSKASIADFASQVSQVLHEEAILDSESGIPLQEQIPMAELTTILADLGI